MEKWIKKIESLAGENEFSSWLMMAVLAAVLTFTVKIVLSAISKKIRKIAKLTPTIWDDVSVDIIDGLKPLVFFCWIFFLMSKSMDPSPHALEIIKMITVVLTIFQIAIWGRHLIRNWRNGVLEKKIKQDPSSAAALSLLHTGIQTAFIVVLVLIGLSNLGINIGALLAGLGVGGIAVALAAQNVLGDLFASLAIVLDRPFAVGDFIVAGEQKGTVENIGIKTTRMRSLSGEEIVLSNKDLLESRIHNHKRMWQRRVSQKFGVAYSTPSGRLEQISIWIKEYIGQHPKLVFDRCHLVGFGDSSLDFEFVFFVSDPDYNSYMDLQQKVLLDIFRRFSAEGVAFAFPSQSLYVEKFPRPVDA